MIDIDKYEGHTKEKWCARNVGDGSPMSCDKDYDHDHPFIETQTDTFENPAIGYLAGGHEAHSLEERRANMELMADAPFLLEFIQKIVKDWCKPNQCNQAFGKDVRQLMYEYGLITFNEETRRYEVKE